MDEADTSDWPDAPCRRGRKQGKARGLGLGSGIQSLLSCRASRARQPVAPWEWVEGGKGGQVGRLGIRWGHLDQSNISWVDGTHVPPYPGPLKMCTAAGQVGR